MINLILNAIPFFLLSIAIEFLVLRHAADDHHGRARGGAGRLRAQGHPHQPDDGRRPRDHLLGLEAGHARRLRGPLPALPLHLDPGNWWVWVLLFFADDLSYYAYHRAHHRIRLFWATHVVHHSSQHYNLSTALRQDWMPISSIFFWAPLALLGFQPWMILLAISWNLLYQFWIHTEKIKRLPGWYEAIFNTPSHHRVHHGANEQYLDKNYGGILIIWDKLFGTYEPERERVRYGLTTNIETLQPDQGRLPRVRRDLARRPRGEHLARAPGLHVQGARLGALKGSDLPSSSTQRSGESGREAEHFPGVISARPSATRRERHPPQLSPAVDERRQPLGDLRAGLPVAPDEHRRARA